LLHSTKLQDAVCQQRQVLPIEVASFMRSLNERQRASHERSVKYRMLHDQECARHTVIADHLGSREATLSDETIEPLGILSVCALHSLEISSAVRARMAPRRQAPNRLFITRCLPKFLPSQELSAQRLV